MSHPELPNTPAWQALSAHAEQQQSQQLRDLFAEDPSRHQRFSISNDLLLLDYSKQRITEETRELLLALAHEAGLKTAIDSMFKGQRLNFTEHRAVLHTALRNRPGQAVTLAGEDIMPAVQSVKQQMLGLCQRVWSGDWRGHTDHPIKHIVNIGIGGSHLGPMLVCEALDHLAEPDLSIDFVSNVDAADMQSVLSRIDPSCALFIIASKTFTTQETISNARLARTRLLEMGCTEQDLGQHFIAVTTNQTAAVKFGIREENTFAFWDWVGGRYSLWSAIGLPIALYLGMDQFEALLQGAHQMDEHFQTAELSENMPAMMALLGVWNINLLGMHQQVMACYDQRLRLLPEHLQQLDMESNGKRIRADGHVVNYATAPILIGGVGTNSQHAYFQLLHQGPAASPVDFITGLTDPHDNPAHHAMLLSNCFAQSEALMKGRDETDCREELSQAGLSGDELEAQLPHRICPGNRPSNTLLFRQLTAETLGALIALYEHKVFVQGIIWQINSFDQWGVELGKGLGRRILQELNHSEIDHAHDSSTAALIDLYRRGSW